MKLVELDSEYNIIINPELFLLDCFVQLRDSRKNPVLLLKEIGYIYFFYNMGSDFQFQTNKKERDKDVRRYVKLPEKWEIDEILQECIDTYLYLSNTVASKMLANAYLSVDKLNDQLNAINLNERDKNDKPVWNIKQFLDTTKALPELFDTLSKAEQAYIKGQEENDKLRGNKMKTLYEDGFKRPKAS